MKPSREEAQCASWLDQMVSSERRRGTHCQASRTSGWRTGGYQRRVSDIASIVKWNEHEQDSSKDRSGDSCDGNISLSTCHGEGMLTHRSKGRSSRPEVYVNHVVEPMVKSSAGNPPRTDANSQADEHAKHREAEKSPSEGRTDPMNRRVRCPSEPEEGDDHGPTGYDTQLESPLWFRRTWVNFGKISLESGLDDGQETV